MKKYNEVSYFKCAVCFGSHALPVCRKLKAKQPAVNAIDPPSKRKPQSLEASESYRPTTWLQGLAQLHWVHRFHALFSLKQTPMDELLPNNGTDPVPMESSIVDQPSIFVSVFRWTYSSHHWITNSVLTVPLPLREDTVELCQRDVAQVAVSPYLVFFDSSEVDDPLKWLNTWVVTEKVLRNCYLICFFFLLFLLSLKILGKRRRFLINRKIVLLQDISIDLWCTCSNIC